MDNIYTFLNKHCSTVDKLQLYDLINHASSDCKEKFPLKLKKEGCDMVSSSITGGSNDIIVFLF